LSVYMQYCCQRNSFCTVNYSVILGDACEGADVLAVLLCDGPEFARRW
jgi:hypothetical protein